MVEIPLTTKIRKGDWVSVDKAIRHLASSKLGPDSTVTYKIVNVTGGLGMGGSQLTDFTIEIVADEAARLALEMRKARVVYQNDSGHLYVCTSL